MKTTAQERLQESLWLSSFSLKKLFFVFAALCVLFIVQPSFAASGINKQINFQGKLVDNSGVNVADSTYTVVFSLYNVSSGGSATWTESDSVTTSNGIFQVALGAGTSLPGDVDFNSDTWYLGIKVGSDAEMTPRIRFTAVPYAFNSQLLDGIIATQSATGFNIQGGTSTQSTVAFTTTGSTLTLQPGNAGGLTIQSNGANGLTLDTGGAAALAIGATANSITFGSTNNPTYSFGGSGTFDTSTGTNTLNGNVIIASGKYLEITGGSGDPTATSGIIWYDTSAKKFKVVENGTVKTICNTTDNGCGSGGGGTSYWTLDSNNGDIYPINTTLDLLAGGTATTSAKFSVLNMTGSGTPVASVSSGLNGNGMSFGANGVVQTARMQSLVLGSSTTGPIQLSPKGTTGLYVDAAGKVGINTITPGYQLDVLSSTTPQLRFGYDASNYFTSNVSSSGGVTFDATGSSAGFTFADDVSVTSGGLTLGTEGSSSGLITLNSSGSFVAPTIQTDNQGNLTIKTNEPNKTLNLGSGSGNILMSLANASDVFIADKTLTLTGSYSSNDFTFKRNITSGSNTTDGALVYITDVGNSSGTNHPDLLFVDSELTSGTYTGNLLRLKNNTADVATVNASGQLDLVGGLSADIDTIGTSNTLTIGGVHQNGLVAGRNGATTTINGSSVVLGSTSNGLTLNPASGPTYTGTARPTKSIVLSPEYAGASLTADGSVTTDGAMTSDDTLNAGSIGWKNYYKWTSTNATLQDYTVAVRVTLPQDFDSWQTGSCGGSTCALEIAYQTGVSGTTDNAVSVQVNNAESTPGTVICTISAVSSTSWTTVGCTSTTLATSPTWNSAGATAILRIKLAADNTSSALARVGDITLRYYAKF